jgi:zinc transport system substrate-binding protein
MVLTMTARLTAVLRGLVAAALLCSLPGCAEDQAAADGTVRVAAAFYPLAFVAERVGGAHVAVTSLTAPGREPHDTELTIRQTGELSEADVAVYLRGFQPAVDEAVDANGPGHVVDAMSAVRTLPARESEAEQVLRRADGSHEDGSLGDVDPHVWLSPANMVAIAARVRDALKEVDGDHRAAYERGYRRLRTDLLALGDAYAGGLRDCALDTVVVSHDAFAYLPTPFRFEAITGLSPDAEPSPAHLAELADLARREGVTTVFAERLAGPELADTLADELGLRTAVLDPVEGLTEATADDDYLSLMRANLAALRTANRCR